MDSTGESSVQSNSATQKPLESAFDEQRRYIGRLIAIVTNHYPEEVWLDFEHIKHNRSYHSIHIKCMPELENDWWTASMIEWNYDSNPVCQRVVEVLKEFAIPFLDTAPVDLLPVARCARCSTGRVAFVPYEPDAPDVCADCKALGLDKVPLQTVVPCGECGEPTNDDDPVDPLCMSCLEKSAGKFLGDMIAGEGGE